MCIIPQAMFIARLPDNPGSECVQLPMQDVGQSALQTGFNSVSIVEELSFPICENV